MDAFLAPLVLSSSKTKRHSRKTIKAHEEGRVVLSIFDIPPGLLAYTERSQEGAAVPSSLNRDEPGSRIVQPENYIKQGTTDRDAQGKAAKRGLTCIRCWLQFGDDRPAQVQHFKSELHMVNLRRQLAGKPPVSQKQLDDEMAAVAAAAPATDAKGSSAEPQGEGDSSSGTDSDDAPAASDFDRGLDLENIPEEHEHVLLSTAEDGSCGRAAESGNKRGRVKVDFSLQEGPRLTFVPHGSRWAFSLSSAALGMERRDDPWARLDSLIGDDEGGGVNRLWAVVILRSGKFAAAVFEGQRVLCHKVFRRYTIRAKRGGSQSSYDSGGRKAQSAGAALRRYGEQALREDARLLLKEWEGPLKACRVVLTSVPKGMRAVLFDGKDAPFDRKDPRLRSVPFAVGKPVFEEVVSVHTQVTSIVFSDAATLNFEDPKATGTNKQDKSNVKSENTNKATAVNGDVMVQGLPKLFEGQLCPPSIELIEACKRGDMDTAVALLDRLELNGDAAAAATPPPPPPPPAPPAAGDNPVPGSSGGTALALEATATGWTIGEVLNRPDGLERLMTPLHVAAAGGHTAVLGMLLQKGANPLAEDVRGRVPYLLASNKDTRDAFRRARAGLPERWDWEAARVPEPLTEELEQRQKEKLKEKEKDKKRRAKLRKKAEKDRAVEEARQQKEKEDAEAEGRRKRGLAAAGHCDACSKVLVAKKAFSRFEFRYCSSDCANLHKRKLAADAAERRFNGGGGEG